tara:strand:+ start:289 stop:486 length:198 start_codon:yes stop_codon:yes gene_type:complete
MLSGMVIEMRRMGMTKLEREIKEINDRIKQMDEDLVSLIISKLDEIEHEIKSLKDEIKSIKEKIG